MSLAENCATRGLIGDSVAVELLMDPNPADETVAIGLLRLFRLRTLKYSALNSKAIDPSIGKLRNIPASQPKYFGPRKDPFATFPKLPAVGNENAAVLKYGLQ
jgi:hypothetical protein